ncbi:MAG: hypothetical protein WBQ23_04535 [Bacteroidota bacterium]
MSAFEKLIEGMVDGRAWDLIGNTDGVRDLLSELYDERYHSAVYHKDKYQVRVNMQRDSSAASYAGWITAENPRSGPYQGTSFVWFPGETGSVAVLVIGTDGFGADTSILGRPGHGRRLRALSRMHKGKVWVKPDLLDIATEIPNVVSDAWPEIASAMKAYSRVIYAATHANGFGLDVVAITGREYRNFSTHKKRRTNMSIIKGLALSVRQPWADLVVRGIKDVENRSWSRTIAADC